MDMFEESYDEYEVTGHDLSIPLSVINTDIERVIKSLVRNMPQEQLEKSALEYLKFENKINSKIENWAKLNDVYRLSRYLEVKSSLYSKDTMEWIDFLITIAISAEKIFRDDEIAMTRLAKDDPATYAQMMLYRKRQTLGRTGYGKYKENYLKKYVEHTENDGLTSLEHLRWHSYIEGHGDNLRKPLTPLSDNIASRSDEDSLFSD